MNTETTRVKLWRCGRTDKAQQFFVLPPGTEDNRTIWIPRSVIHHVSTLPCKPGEPQPCIVDVESWLVETEGL